MIDITERIEQAFHEEKRDQPREYIGASGIGHACDANTAFSWRGYPDTPPDSRLKRIFRDGHRIETQVVKDMRKAGLQVMEQDPMTGKQWRYTRYGGHAMGNADGLIEIEGRVVGLEIKSMNDDKFKSFRDHGVKYSHPIYYDQMQFIMGMSGIHSFVIVSYNKNTSEYHHQYIEFDEFRFYSLEAKVERVLSNQAQRVSHDESDWRCRGCFKFDACWKGALPSKRDVRTCGNSIGNSDGTFSCSVCDGQSCPSWRPYEPIPKEARP
jgi:hypothetical protein